MVVAPDALIGTIGGGALEYMVIARARQALRDGEEPEGLDIPLGPEIGQCCGGRVEVSLRRLTRTQAAALVARLRRDGGDAAACLSVRLGACRARRWRGRWRRCRSRST